MSKRKPDSEVLGSKVSKFVPFLVVKEVDVEIVKLEIKVVEVDDKFLN